MYTSSRGASVLAAIAFVAVLGIALTGIEILSPTNSNSQTAQVAAPVTTKPPTTTGTTKPAPLTDAQIKSICDVRIKAAAAKGENTPNGSYKSKGTETDPDNCIAAAFDPNSNAAKSPPTGKDPKNLPEAYKCVGKDAVVTMNPKVKGEIDLETYPAGAYLGVTRADDKPGTCKVYHSVKTTCTGRGFTGDPVQCSTIDWNGGVGLQDTLLNKNAFNTLTPDEQKAVIDLGPMSQAQQTQLQQAFQEQQTAISAANSAITQQCGAGPDNSCQATINQQIARAAGLNCETTPDGACVVNGGDAARLLAANKEDLDRQMKQLAQAQVALDPTSAGGCPASPGCPGNPNGGVPPPSSGPSPSTNNGSTFGGGSGSGASGLSSLLSGLAKGLTGGGAAAAPPPPAPAQACSTDSTTYQQQQQQYQTALQQYNYQLQQYNYQLQLNAQYNNSVAPIPPQQPTACSPSTQNQCSTQPQQPAASTCSQGTWQPVYSGSCITRWQCGGAGTASLSCQPQTADVGMSIAISYSCSSGTATGSGFTASGQSGTSTATVATPPQGTNTATYSLSCDNNGQTFGAQCSIQVATPSIVLVANPKTVQSGGTSQIGWITSGMQSCVISSPDQPDFTAQNAANTSVGGTAETGPISASSASFTLHCQTVAGGTKDATTTVQVQ